MESIEKRFQSEVIESKNIFWDIQTFFKDISDSLLLRDTKYYLTQRVFEINSFEELLKFTKNHSTFSWENLVMSLWVKKVFSTNEITSDFTQNLRWEREIYFRAILYFLEKDLWLYPPDIVHLFQENKIFVWNTFLDNCIQNWEIMWWNWN